MKRLPLALVALMLALAAPIMASAQTEKQAVCYNCPPEWADWGTMLKAIKTNLDIAMPSDNKNSGQAVAQLTAEKAAPVADVVYLGVTAGIQAAKNGLTTAYKPKGFDAIPAGLKDPDGKWFAVHSGTIGFFVNTDALEGKPVPQCFSDLLKPEYRGMIGYLDPSSAFVGYASAVAINYAEGGTLQNFKPALDYFAKLKANRPIVPKQTSYARVVSGEIPIMLDYDFNAYRAKYTEDGHFQFVIPCEGSIQVPYVMSMVKNAPHPEAAKKILDFILSDKGEAIWANAYLRPSRPVTLPKEIADRFLPAKDYARARTVDYAAMQTAQEAFGKAYLAEMQ